MNLNFCLDLSKNIENIQIFVGEFSDLEKLQSNAQFISKKHPLFSHYTGEKDERDWMFPEVVTSQPSFFKYWEKIMKTPTFKKIKIK
jgi:deoxyribodipyrimidine photo-lyase